MNPSLAGSRGRLSSEHRAYVLEAHANHESIEVIAERLGRSIESIRKVVEVPQEPALETAHPAPWELDDILDFLAELPEEAMDEVLQLSRLQRQTNHLRQSLSSRLQRKPLT